MKQKNSTTFRDKDVILSYTNRKEITTGQDFIGIVLEKDIKMLWQKSMVIDRPVEKNVSSKEQMQ